MKLFNETRYQDIAAEETVRRCAGRRGTTWTERYYNFKEHL